MSDQLSLEEQNQAIEHCEQDEEMVAAEAARKIYGTDVVLRKILQYIPLKNIPNFNLASRRLWWFCHDELKTRSYEFYEFRLLKASKNVNRIEVIKEQMIGDRTTIFPLVKPPYKFKVNFLIMPKNIGRKGMEFLRMIKPQLDGALLFINFSEVCVLDKYLNIFDNCERMGLHFTGQRFSHEIWAKKGIRHCNKLVIFSKRTPSQKSVIDWLYSPVTKDSDTKQLIFTKDTPRSYTLSLFERLKKKFSEDTMKHKYLVFGLLDADLGPGFRMENQQTGEVLCGERQGSICILTRCDKEDEKEDKFKYNDFRKQTRIMIGEWEE